MGDHLEPPLAQPPLPPTDQDEQINVSTSGDILAQVGHQPALPQAPQAPTQEGLPPLNAGNQTQDHPTGTAEQPPLPPEDDHTTSPEDHHQAIIVHDPSAPPLPQDDSSEPSSSDDEEEEEFAGPIHPPSCIASGPGVTGGSLGATVRITVQARDENGRKIKEGGAYVKAQIKASGPSANTVPPTSVELTDSEDGTYIGTYTVPAKGNFQIVVEVNGQEISDSPFPVYFSPADTTTVTATAGAAGTTTANGGVLAITAAGGEAVTGAVPEVAAAVPVAPQAPALSIFPNMSANYRLSLGVQAAQVGVQFPPVDDATLQRTVLVGGLTPFATRESLQSIFALCGAIRSINVSPASKAYAFVEFMAEAGVKTACSMTGVSLLGQAIRVESALEARTAAQACATDSSNPFQALQMHQLQAFHNMQQQQVVLAQKVAAMHGVPYNSLTTAAAPQPTAPTIVVNNTTKDHHHCRDDRDNRDRDRRRSRDRDDRKPTTSSRRRSRSRSRSRGTKDKKRYRSRSRSRDRHDDRRRDRDGRRRSRSRSRDRERRKREKDRRRSRSRDRRDRDGKDSRRDRDRKEREGDRGEKYDTKKSSKEEVAALGVKEDRNGDKDELEELFDELEG